MPDHIEPNGQNGEIAKRIINTVEEQQDQSEEALYMLSDLHAAVGTITILAGTRTHVDLESLDENRRPMHRDDEDLVGGWGNFIRKTSQSALTRFFRKNNMDGLLDTQDVPASSLGQPVDDDLGTGQSHRRRMRQELEETRALERFARPTQYDRYDPDHPLVSSTGQNDRANHASRNSMNWSGNAGSSNIQRKGRTLPNGYNQLPIAETKGKRKAVSHSCARGADQNSDYPCIRRSGGRSQWVYGQLSKSKNQIFHQSKQPIKTRYNGQENRETLGISNSEPSQSTTSSSTRLNSKQPPKAKNPNSKLATHTVNQKQPSRSFPSGTASQDGKAIQPSTGTRLGHLANNRDMVWGPMGPVRKLASPDEFMAYNKVALQPPWPQRTTKPIDVKQNGTLSAVPGPSVQQTVNAQEDLQGIAEGHPQNNGVADLEDMAVVEDGPAIENEGPRPIDIAEFEQDAVVETLAHNITSKDLQDLESHSSVSSVLINDIQALNIEQTPEPGLQAINLIDVGLTTSAEDADATTRPPSTVMDLNGLDFSYSTCISSSYISEPLPSLLDGDLYSAPVNPSHISEPQRSLLDDDLYNAPGSPRHASEPEPSLLDDDPAPLVFNPIQPLTPILVLWSGNATESNTAAVGAIDNTMDRINPSGENSRLQEAAQTSLPDVRSVALSVRSETNNEGSRAPASTNSGNASLSASIWASAAGNSHNNHWRR